MLFNSIDFAIFLPIVFALYWSVFQKNLKAQNFFIVIASYTFYGWWDWRFLGLIVFSTLVDFMVSQGLKAENEERRRKLLVILSIVVNLGFLGFFKYYNFFVESFISGFSFLGQDIQANTLNIILPVGISFYTFQTLSYTIDVYKRKLEPTKDLISFAAFVAFFPQLVAGPIERASNLLPQFYRKRQFEYASAVNGMRQILWGLFKKMVIADNCAEYANHIFNNSADLNGMSLFLGALFFAFQIYGDFSGYSDIAIGTARLFGFNLKQNFAFPYFSRDIAEFWRRWHISLSTWFRDYLYIPIGGSRGGKWLNIRNVFIIFIVSGFWHGANWTFIFWGALNAVFFLPLLLLKSNRKNLDVVAQDEFLPSLREGLNMIMTFLLVVLAWIFFRAESLPHAFQYIGDLFSSSFFSVPDFKGRAGATATIILIFCFLILEWFGRSDQFGIEKYVDKWSKPIRWGFYIFLVFIILMFAKTTETPFIYFQF